ncbi:MAG: hypothetical protein Q9183_002811 [Haloplaca sp. 2 TL-2023]
MTPAFVFAPTNSLSRCTPDQTANLRLSFTDALEAVRQAVQAIDDLKKKPPIAGLQQKKRRTWKRQARLFFSLFGIEVNTKTPIGESNVDANKVQYNFQKILDGLDYSQVPDLIEKYWLFCGDDWLQWKAATDVDELDEPPNNDPKRTLAEKGLVMPGRTGMFDYSFPNIEVCCPNK